MAKNQAMADAFKRLGMKFGKRVHIQLIMYFVAFRDKSYCDKISFNFVTTLNVVPNIHKTLTPFFFCILSISLLICVRFFCKEN